MVERFGFFMLIAVALATNALGQGVTGNAARGARVLFERGCLNCHGLNGNASDLSRTPRNAITPEALAAEMWNHLPQMWSSTGSIPDRPLTPAETTDLFAYLYSTLYFAFPGNADRGRRIFETKNCVVCHNDNISTWQPVDDPIVWTERMWNHSPEMNRAMTQKGLRWPALSGQEIADLIIYLRSRPELRPNSGTFKLGEPEQGKLVFDRTCSTCHSFGPVPSDRIDLLGRPFPVTVIGYIAVMWNHAPQMRLKSGEQFPTLNTGEMSNLIAFLFSEAYLLKRGDAAQGRFTFENKKCAVCHENRRQETGAPNLFNAAGDYTAITLISAAWRHGPQMSEMMRQNRIAWPRFQNSEMSDLIAYLNRHAH